MEVLLAPLSSSPAFGSALLLVGDVTFDKDPEEPAGSDHKLESDLVMFAIAWSDAHSISYVP
jgi:hypothetical protein